MNFIYLRTTSFILVICLFVCGSSKTMEISASSLLAPKFSLKIDVPEFEDKPLTVSFVKEAAKSSSLVEQLLGKTILGISGYESESIPSLFLIRSAPFFLISSFIAYDFFSFWHLSLVVLGYAALVYGVSYFKKETFSKDESFKEIKTSDGLIVSESDWNWMIGLMQQRSVLSLDLAHLAWNYCCQRLRNKKILSVKKERFDFLEKYWKEEIEELTPNERVVFEDAKTIKGLRIGFDMDGVIVPVIDTYEELNLTGGSFHKRVLLRPGIKPLLMGLMFHSEIQVDTAASRAHVLELAQRIPFFRKFLACSKVTLKTAKEMVENANATLLFQKPDSFGRPYYSINGIPLTGNEVTNFFKEKRTLKLPSELGVDILIEDHPFLGPFLTRLLGQSSVFRVRSYHFKSPPSGKVKAMLSYHVADAQKKHHANAVIQSDFKYEKEVLSAMTILKELARLSLEKQEVYFLKQLSLFDLAI